MNTRSMSKKRQNGTKPDQVPPKKVEKKDTEANIGTNQTSLQVAVANGNLEIVKHLLDDGSKQNLSVQENNSLIRTCISKNRLDIVKCLIKSDAGINEQDQMGETLLHFSAKNGRLEILKYLLECGAEVNIRTDYNVIPLHYAIKEGNLEMVKELLNRTGKTSQYESVFKNMSVHFAAQYGKDEVLTLLIEAGYPLDGLYQQKQPIHVAALCGHWKVVRTLLKSGIDINAKAKNDLTPLHFAALSGRVSVIKFLLESGSNLPDFPNRKFIPYIMGIVVNKNQWIRKSEVKSYVEILKLLISYTPDEKIDDWLMPNIRSAFKFQTPIELLDVLFEFDINQCTTYPYDDCKSSKHFVALIDHIDHFAKLYCVLYNLTPLDLKSNKFIKDKEIESLVARLTLLESSDDPKSFEGVFILFLQNLLEKHYVLCCKEKKDMENAKIDEEANVTYFDILTKPIDKVASYLKNEQILNTLENEYTKFDAYALLLEKRIKKGKQRKNLLEDASNSFFNIVKDRFDIQLPSLVIEKVFEYLSPLNCLRLLSVD